VKVGGPPVLDGRKASPLDEDEDEDGDFKLELLRFKGGIERCGGTGDE
jgi:hypothetical protein